MIYIDRQSVPIPKFLLKNDKLYGKEILSRLERQSKFKQSRFKHDDSIFYEVQSDLVDLFNSKCAYCESIIEKPSVDHFRPSESVSDIENRAFDGYYWLAYTWFNLYLTCHECRRYKSNNFPVLGQRLKPPTTKVYLEYRELFDYVQQENSLLLDPCDRRAHEKVQFYYNNSGHLVPQSEQANYTLELLQLNRQNLVEIRVSRIKELSEILSNISFNKDEYAALDSILFYLRNNHSHLGLNRYMISEWFQSNQYLIKEEYPKLFKDFQHALEKNVPDWQQLGELDALSTFKPFENVMDPEKVTTENEFSKFIEWVEVFNFKCIEHIRIKIPQNTLGTGEQSILLIGENGVGKSTVLQAISLAMMGNDQLQTLNLGKYNDLIRRNSKSRKAKIILKFLNENSPVTVKITPDGISSNRKQLVKPTVAIGSVRRMPEDGEKVTFNDDSSRILGLFRHDVVFPDVQPWLTNVNQINADQFNEAAKTIIDMLMIPEDLISEGRMVNRKAGRVTVNIGNGPESIKSMSDGYRSVIGYALYIMRSLNLHWESAYNAEGLIVIDEIGNHLHPTWKIKVVSLLRKVFPRCTLIISTHDPLCLRAARTGEVWVMSLNEKDRGIQLAQKDIPPGMSLENLLIGDWFYMVHTADEHTSKLVEEHTMEMYKEHPNQKRIKNIEEQLEQTVMKSSSAIGSIDTYLDMVKEEKKKITVDLSKDTEFRDKLAQRIRDQIKS